MAITFLKQLHEDKLNLIYNNNVVEFYTDSTEQILKAEITIGSTTITLFPDPTSKFFYNFKELMIAIMNTNNYADLLETDLDSSFVYDWASEVYLNTDIVFTIFLGNNTTDSITKDIHFLSGFVQLRYYKQAYPAADLLTTKTALLQPKINDSYYNHFIKYWAGFPFDITIFKIVNDFTILNKTNAIDFTFDTTSAVNRLLFSDGRTDVSIEDVLPLQNGYNDLDVDTDFNILTEKITGNCEDKHYLKWINSLGGWNYWLFDKGNESLKNKESGFLFNDFNNLNDTTSPLVNLGKTSQNNIQLSAHCLTEFERVLLHDMLDSPKIYLFTGVPFSKNTFNDWMEVNLVGGTFAVANARGNQYNLNATIELPNNITRTL